MTTINIESLEDKTMKKTRTIVGDKVTVRRTTSKKTTYYFPDTYDLYEVRVNQGPYKPVRPFLLAPHIRTDAKQAVATMCQEIFEELGR